MNKQAMKQAKNLTGIATNIDGAKAMVTAAAQVAPSSSGTKVAADMVRIEYARELAPSELGYGSVPQPPTAAGESKLLLDKLGERLYFERAGVRLYEALISKLEAFGSYDGGPSREELMQLLNEEHSHFELLEGCLLRIGGDPTAMSPAADLALNVGSGVTRVVTDFRTTLLQSLEAILVAELVDNQCWSALIELARALGDKQMVQEFRKAEQTEEEHLTKVRRWVSAGYQAKIC